ncbi:ATP-binding protein [Aeromonas hydrophila]|uniref:ATP-binding protein n=1 Tax=Aeromonas hydrophila TaxID=644 RepID=UPI002B49855B|nr:ATP-binding protein [Aeromonas hydrophila]
MLVKYNYKHKTFHFLTDDNISKQNAFTVIVGKNGTGKSRLMKSIIEEFIGRSTRSGILRGLLLTKNGFSFDQESSNLEIETMPDKIIAVSTSPFDKFPLDLYGSTDSAYTYLGLRNLRSIDLGMAYMANIYISLLKSVMYEPDRIEKICQVLGFLGYSPRITARYDLDFPMRVIYDSLYSSDPVQHLIEYIKSDSSPQLYKTKMRAFYDDEKNIDPLKVERVIDIYRKIFPSNTRPSVNIFLEKDGIYIPPQHFETTIDDLFYLADIGIAKLKSINLEKNNGDAFNIGDASSGEQSVVMSILGIASKICDNSLICIDEPEICLHPEWQEKYIDILINTFKGFSGCHFLIATHSPLMVSKLEDQNCYLLKMEDGQATPASEVNKRSVDFQLANTFNTPGYKNEYLTRELITILTVFGETGSIDDKNKNNIASLLSLKEQLDKSDPVYKLMEMAQEALKESF